MTTLFPADFPITKKWPPQFPDRIQLYLLPTPNGVKVSIAPKRLLAVLERRLEGRAWIMGDEYTIADIATFPWVRNLVGFYGAGELVGFPQFTNVQRVLDAFVARPAVQLGLGVPKRA